MKTKRDTAIRVLKRIPKALLQWPFSPSAVKHPRLIMTLLVKNEAEKLEHNLIFHHAMGVDGFIVTDNNSTDDTMNIIRHYQQKGWILDVIEEPSTGYEQKQWVDRMVMMACERHKADWVINADADEFWYAPQGNLKDEMTRCTSRVLKCRLCNMYPEEETPFHEWSKCVEPVPQPTHYDLSPYSIFGHRTYKVAHRTQGYLHISMGNHKVAMIPPTQTMGNIIIYHYTIGNRAAFINKMVQGGQELEHHQGGHGGVHWRYFYGLYKDGRLSEEYDRVIGKHAYDRLVADGYIVEDPTIRDFFRNNLPNNLISEKA